MPPKVTIIIVTWNALDLLERCFPSVARTDYPHLEIVVADNASTDESVRWISATYPQVQIIRHPENWLFARGNNEAIRQTESDYIALLNNDVEVEPNWLTLLVRELEASPDVAAVQPKLLQYHNRGAFEYAGASGGFIDRFGYPFTRGRIFDHMENDHGQYDDARDVFWASGAALLLRRSALDAVGLFDEQFEMHMEEIDLCWRLRRHGFRVRVAPESKVYHLGGGSLPKTSPRKVYYNFRNSLLMLYKNLPPPVWTTLLPRRALLDGTASTRAAAAGRGREATAIIRAYRDANRMKNRYRGARAAAGESLPPYIYHRSIVADYFLRGRRTFAALPETSFSSPRSPE